MLTDAERETYTVALSRYLLGRQAMAFDRWVASELGLTLDEVAQILEPLRDNPHYEMRVVEHGPLIGLTGLGREATMALPPVPPQPRVPGQPLSVLGLVTPADRRSMWGLPPHGPHGDYADP